MNVKQAPEEQEEIRQLKHAFRMEKDADVSKRLHLIILMQRDSMDAADAAAHMSMSRTWGRKWYRRYRNEGIAGLQTRPRSGRPPKVHRDSMEYLRERIRRNTTCTAQDVSDQIHAVSGVRYSLSYVHRLIKKWGS